jgi:hypothetical protein
MKNVMKIMFVLISSFAITAANAGEVSVTGNAKATYNIASSDSVSAQNDNGKAIGITNELTFVGTGELDNGWTWKWQTELDPDAAGATQSDDTQLVITTGMGTIGIMNTEGNLSTKYKHAASAYGIGSDNGNGGGMTYGKGMNAYNSVQYTTPAMDMLPYDMAIKVAYSPGDAVEANGAANAGAQSAINDVKSVQITGSGNGLSAGASYTMVDATADAAQKSETGGVFAKYAAGPFTVGVSRNLYAPNTNAFDTGPEATAVSATNNIVKYYTNNAVSLGYNVNDNLSISVDIEESDAEKRTITKANKNHVENNVELEIKTAQAAYSMGGMTLAISSKEIENADYVTGKDAKETFFSMAMAF